MHTTGSMIQLAHALHNTPAAPRLYLSSTHAGWAGLVAQAFQEPPEIASWVVPARPAVSLIVFAGGAMHHHTYSADPRGVGFMVFYEQLPEPAPKGGKEGEPVTRQDEYKGAIAAATATG